MQKTKGNKLTEDDIKVGDYLELTKGRCGQVKYKGPFANKEGTHFGVELIGSVGKMSGSFRNKHYFECEELRGMMVQMDRVRKKLSEQQIMANAQNESSQFAKMGLSKTTLNIQEEVPTIEDQKLQMRQDVQEQIANMTPKDVSTQVNQWLRAGGEHFIRLKIDGRQFFKMNGDDLGKIGLRPGKVRKLQGFMKTYLEGGYLDE